MKRLAITLLAFMALFLFVGGVEAQTVTPSKKYITRELKNMSDFSAIKVLGSPDVEYTQSTGKQVKVTLYGSDNLLDLLEVTTQNGVLQVNIKKGVNIRGGERRLKVIASSPALKQVDILGSSDVTLKGNVKGTDLNLAIAGSGDIKADKLNYTNITATVNGSGDIDLKNITATNVNVNVAGSGDVNVIGSAQKAVLKVAGSGDIEAQKLVAAHVIADVAGSGDIDCYASKQLDAKLAGSGEITYKGKPAVVNKKGKKKQIVNK